MRLRHVLPLLISVLSLTGCVGIQRTDYSWVKPIHFSDQTVDWLMNQEWPESAYADFDQILKHNEKCKLILGKP